jgi:hypothetical protein
MAGWNLALRFGLEVAALTGLASGGWNLSTTGLWRWVVAIGVPLLAAIAWGTFNVVDDPSRSGAAPVEIPGGMRLALELAILAAGAAGFLGGGYRVAGLALGALILVHYAASIPRIEWLLQRQP